jgi:hypothetical protein
MSEPPIQDLHPEVLDAFLGKAPLETAKGHFLTRKELLQAYAETQATTFGEATMRRDKCDLCGVFEPPSGQLWVVWSARLGWNRRTIIHLILLSPLLLPLALSHVGAFALNPILDRMQIAERLEFATIHPLCHRCVAQLRWRRLIHAVGTFILGFLGTVTGITTIILSAVIIAAFCRAFQLAPHDARELMPYWLLAANVAAATILVGRIVGKRVLFPGAVHGLMKRPFAYRTYRIKTSKGLIKPL